MTYIDRSDELLDWYSEDDAAPAPSEVHRGQVRMAYRLADRYANRLLHVHGIGWHAWDGTRFVPDETR